MFVVMVTATEGQEPEPIGPFETPALARRWVERVQKCGYQKTEVVRLFSPLLAGPVDGAIGIVFDPALGIDR